MNYRLLGEIAQYVDVELELGESLWASRGCLMSHGDGVRWSLRLPGGVKGSVKRMLSGEGFSLLFLETDRPQQRVLLGAGSPGHLIEWDLADGPVLTTGGSFVAAWGEDIRIDVTLARRPGALVFGGAGLFLQRIAGRGTVLIHAHGDVRDMQLAEGERVLVSTGSLAAFADRVDYDIQSTGSVGRMLFSGEGLFMTRLTGPGRVLLQSLKPGTATQMG